MLLKNPLAYLKAKPLRSERVNALGNLPFPTIKSYIVQLAALDGTMRQPKAINEVHLMHNVPV